MNKFEASGISGGLYCNSNVSGETETYAKLIFIWWWLNCDSVEQPRIQCRFCFTANDKQ